MRTASLLFVSLASLLGCTIDAPTYSDPGSLVDAAADSQGDTGSPDAISGHRVGGVVDGLWSPAAVALRLQAGDVDELLSVVDNGGFEFPPGLEDGTSFTVSVATQPPSHACTVFSGTGQVPDGVGDVVVRCAGPIAVDVGLDLPGIWSFDATSTRNELDASVLAQELSVVVDAPDADSILVDGAALTSGARSATIPLARGPNEVELRVVAGSVSRSWSLVIDRGAVGLSHVRRLKASGPNLQDEFGSTVAGDGNDIAVGARLEDGGPAPSSGAAYATSIPGSFVLAYLKASNAASGDAFGTAVALDGDTLVVTANAEDSGSNAIDQGQPDDSAQDAGAAYVFRRSGNGWAPEAYLKASNSDPGDIFGWSVALHGDLLVVGAPGESSAASGIGGDQLDNSLVSAGAAYVFRRSGGAWTQEAYLKASNPGSDWFGMSVAVSGDWIAVGAPNESSSGQGVNPTTNEAAARSGAVYVFHRSSGVWVQEAMIKASNAQTSDRFGGAIELDGDRLAVGAIEEDSAAVGVNGIAADNSAPDSGAVYVFRRDPSGWVEEAYVKASNTGADDYFGSSLDLRGDLLVVGALGEDGGEMGVDADPSSNSAPASGAVYLFEMTGDGWMQTTYVKASNTTTLDRFGAAVGLTGTQMLVGAPREDSSNPNNGAANDLEDSGAAYVLQ